jgi:hypothetical protein
VGAGKPRAERDGCTVRNLGVRMPVLNAEAVSFVGTGRGFFRTGCGLVHICGIIGYIHRFSPRRWAMAESKHGAAAASTALSATRRRRKGTKQQGCRVQGASVSQQEEQSC